MDTIQQTLLDPERTGPGKLGRVVYWRWFPGFGDRGNYLKVIVDETDVPYVVVSAIPDRNERSKEKASMTGKHTPYTYDREFDILSLSTKMDYQESATIAYDLMASFDPQGHCMGFEFLDAAYLFLPYLCPDQFPQFDLEDGLTISYSSESDALSFHNSEPVSYSENVLDHCIAHLGR